MFWSLQSGKTCEYFAVFVDPVVHFAAMHHLKYPHISVEENGQT